MNDLFLVINEAGLIECASPTAALAFGYPLTELSGLPWSRVLVVPDRVGPETSSEFWLGASRSPLLQGIHRSGRMFPLLLAEQEIHGTTQTHWILFLRDPGVPDSGPGIFSKHRELHELAARQGRISVWEVDYRTNFLQFSPVLAEMLELSEEQVPTTVNDWKQHFHPDDWRNLERESERMLCREISQINVECRVFHSDGSLLWLMIRGQASFDDEGLPLKTIGTGIDITDRKRAEEERDLFFTMSLDMLGIADMQGYFHRVNPAFCKTLGYSEEDLTSRPFLSFVHPDDVESTKEAVSVLSRGENVVAFENRYRCKDGSWRWLSWSTPAPPPNSDKLYAIARDITEQKRVAAELEQAMRDAENANRAKSEFLSRMSHELRTPLNAILGFGQLLQREPLADRQRRQIDLIVGGGRHLLNLINEVLDITRIEAGRMDLSSEPVEVASLLQETVNLTQPMADVRGIGVTIDLVSVTGQSVRADRQRLKQVLLNLLANAIKYNVEHGSVIIRGEAVPPHRFRIHVQDTGPGIAPDKQLRLFTPFDRLGAESTPTEGSGLGLVLSKRLMEIMDGTLTLVSEVGRGSTFTTELTQTDAIPLVVGAVAVPMVTATAATAARTLLYIEDNLTNVRLVEAVLAFRPGIQLVTATQGAIGLQLARQCHPDLILLDVHLPDLNGATLMTALHADPAMAATPVIVISADATKRQIEYLLAAGAKEYLTKPIDVELLLRIVDRYLDRGK